MEFLIWWVKYWLVQVWCIFTSKNTCSGRSLYSLPHLDMKKLHRLVSEGTTPNISLSAMLLLLVWLRKSVEGDETAALLAVSVSVWFGVKQKQQYFCWKERRLGCTDYTCKCTGVFYLEHWSKVSACFGIDLIKVLFKGFFFFFVNPLNQFGSQWIVGNWLRIYCCFNLSFVAISTVIQTPCAFLSCPVSQSGWDASSRRRLPKRTATAWHNIYPHIGARGMVGRKHSSCINQWKPCTHLCVDWWLVSLRERRCRRGVL